MNCWGKAPEIFVVVGGIFCVGSIVLRDRLHRPFDRMTAGILHRCVKRDERRIDAETNRAHKLQTGLWISWSGQAKFRNAAPAKELENRKARRPASRNYPPNGARPRFLRAKPIACRRHN